MFTAAALALLVTIAIVSCARVGADGLRSRAGRQHRRHRGRAAARGHGLSHDRPDFLDLAIAYGLLNLIGMIAVLKFFRYGDLGYPGDGERGAGWALR